MRVRLLGALLAATVLAALAAGPAGAAPEQVSRAEIRWRLGDRLDTRLTRSCIRPRATSRSGGGYTGGAYSHNGNATGTVDAAARTGGATLSSGTLRFAKTRRAARGFGSVSLGRARCRGGRARTRIRAGSSVGTVSLAFSPARATGLAGTLAVRLFLSAARDPATGQLASVDTVPIAPAAADGEGIALPIAGAAALVRGTGDAFLPTSALATTAGVAFTAGSARVDVTDIAFAYSAAGRLQGITATVAGVRRALTVAAADGSLTGEPGAMAAIASALGLPSVSVVTAAADAGFTRTGPA